MRTFMKHKSSVLGDLDGLAEKAREVRRITGLLEHAYAEDEQQTLQEELQGHIAKAD